MNPNESHEKKLIGLVAITAIAALLFVAVPLFLKH
jgi:hypothetical protein